VGQQEAELGEHWGPGGEVAVEPAPGLAVTELPADGLRGHVRHGVDDVAVEDPDVLGLAPAVAAGVLRDAVLAGTGGLAAAEQDTHVLGRVSVLTEVGDVSAVRGVVAQLPTLLHTVHSPEPSQEVVSVSLAHRVVVVAGAVHWGPSQREADQATEEQDEDVS